MTTEWPDLDTLKQLLDVTSDDYNDHLDILLDAAVAKVKEDVGDWDDDEDAPDDALHQAALRAAILMRPNASESLELLRTDHVYQSLLFGKRRKFGIA